MSILLTKFLPGNSRLDILLSISPDYPTLAMRMAPVTRDSRVNGDCMGKASGPVTILPRGFKITFARTDA
jgi:hypothetical protein